MADLKLIVIPVSDSELGRIRAVQLVCNPHIEDDLQRIIGERRWQQAFRGESANQVEVKFVVSLLHTSE